MSNLVKIKFKHWKTSEPIEVIGKPVVYNSSGASDRIHFLKENGSYEDIIKNTIIQMWEQQDDEWVDKKL